jgi:signal transduction histidine kinase/CheY-like chemotaxis protein
MRPQKEKVLDSQTLKFFDNTVETEYQKHNNRHRRRLNIIMMSMLLAYSIINDLLYNLKPFNDTIYNNIYFFNKVTSYVTTGLYGIMLILAISSKNITVQCWVSILAFYFLLSSNTVLRIYLVLTDSDYFVFAFIYSFQLLFRFSWFYFGLIDFYQDFYITFALCITNWVYFGYYIPMEYHFRFSLENMVTLKALVVAYFYIKERKKGFYYNGKLRKVNLWLQGLLDNVNNGFIKIKKDNIDVINKVMVKSIMLNENVKSSYIGRMGVNEKNFIIKNTNIVMNELLRNLKYDNDKYNNYNGYSKIDVLKLFLEENSYLEEFYFVGMVEYHTFKDILYYELYGRTYSTLINDGEEKHEYELSFNNVTNAKLTENANAEIKYKSVFLSKIAHEFKNPLLCIKELINEMSDCLEGANPNLSVPDILINIKSMSDYLIILIKDMDFFSLSQDASRKISLDQDKLNLNELINFCQNITQTLLKKFHKEDRVKLVIEKTDVPNIITADEIKLKQILINLLSNSVKFTMNGFIVLKVEGVPDAVKFSISDTGTGMNEETKQNLFKPFLKTNSETNAIGSGLGLSIVKDLLEAFGSKIEFTSFPGMGTEFYFSINCQARKHTSDLNKSIVTSKTEYHEFEPLRSYKYIQENILKNKPSIYGCSAKIKTILVVDDEITNRRSTIRLLKRLFNKRGLDIDIQEASDGIECLYLYYLSFMQGNSISLIISDQTMTVMNGITCADILYDISKSIGSRCVPFVLLTAYELSTINMKNSIVGCFTKPISECSLDKIIKLIE